MIEVRPSTRRHRSEQPGITSWHCFAAGAHYDPDNTGFGPLIGVDEHLLAPGAGFAAHRHRGVEIITWVVAGALCHTDTTGGETILRPGVLGVLTAGSGVAHSEVNASREAPLRFVQLTLLAEANTRPGYRCATQARVGGGVVSVHRSGPLRTRPGRVHLLVTGGEFALDTTPLRPGDAARCTEPVTVTGSGVLLTWAAGG